VVTARRRMIAFFIGHEITRWAGECKGSGSTEG
jgi:hypothetical protein